TGGLEVAAELFVEKQPAERPSRAVILRLLRHLYIERSASGHGCLLLCRFASPFVSPNTDDQAGECQSEKNYELFHGFLRCHKIIASLAPHVLKKRDTRMIRRKTDPPRGILTTAVAYRQRFRHERYHPSPDLDPYVEHYWIVEWDLRGRAPERVETLPHPSVHIIFEQGGGSRIRGAARAKFSRLLEDKGGVFAVKFTPGGFYPFVGVTVSRFSDTTATLHDVFGAEGDDLDRAILAESEDISRINLVEDFLRARRPEPDENVPRVTEIVYAVAKDRGIL